MNNQCPECGQAMPTGWPDPLDLTKELPSDLAVGAGTARDAARLLEHIDEGGCTQDHLDSAAWRLADALYLVAQATKGTPLEGDCPGVDYHTGRGAKLHQRGEGGGSSNEQA